MEPKRECARSRDGNDDWVTLLPSHYAIILSPGLILLKKKKHKKRPRFQKRPLKQALITDFPRRKHSAQAVEHSFISKRLEREGERRVWAGVTIPFDRILFFFPSVQMCFQLAAVSLTPLCPFSIVLLSFFTHQLKLLLFWARTCPLASSWVITQCACN